MISNKVNGRAAALMFSLLASLSLNHRASAYDWLQFEFSPDKTGNITSETTINTSNVSGLKQLFKVGISDSPDGAPVLLTGVSTPAGVKDLIFIQGYKGALTAYDAHNGSTVWSKSFSGAGNSAPAIDLNRQFIYLNTSSAAHKLKVGDGTEVTGGGWPETTGSGKSSSELTVAIAKDGHEYLYCANQGHACVTAINLDTGTQHVFNLAASDQPDTHSPTQTQSGANPWSRAIPYDSSLDLVFEMGGTNNGSGWTAGKLWRQSWVAIAANGSTRVTGGLGYPVDSYTPTNWSASVSSDQDIGSGGLGILPVGLSSKYPHLGVQPGKDHNIRILNLANLSGKGAPGNLGGELFLYSFPAMSMMRSEVCIWTNPADGQVWAFTPGHNGIAGFKVMIDSSGNPSLVLAWSDVFTSVHFNTSAFVANNVLYAATGGGEHTSTESPRQVNAMDPTTGTVLWSGAIGQFHWTSPILANGILYMADGPAGGFGSGSGNLTAWSLGSSGPTPVADPTFSPTAGLYSSAQSVTISTTTSGASIRYTTDGSIPSETAGTVYGGAVTLSSTTTLKAIAYKSGMSDSNVVVGTYTINNLPTCAAPTFTPAAGTYTSAQSVTISTTTAGASIHYTTDGSTPSETTGTLYNGVAITVGSTTTVKAIAYESGFNDSTISSATYTIGAATPINYEAETSGHTTSGPTSTIQTDANSSGGKWVSLDANAVGQYIEYNIGTAGGGAGPILPAGTYQLQMKWKGNNGRGILQLAVDGTNLGPTLDQYASGQTYPTTTFGTVTFPTDDNHIIRLTVTGKNSASSGYVLSADKFTFNPVSVQQQTAAPVFSPGGGSYGTAQSVTITSATSGASIRYTTDGSTPTETAGTIYSGPVNISVATTLKAIAYASGLTDSTVTSASYTIGTPPQTVTLEAENLSPVGNGATVSISNDANASGGVIEFLNSTAAGQTMTFTTPSIPAGTYQVQLRYKNNTTRGQHTVAIDGTQVGGTVDQYAKTSTYVSTTLGNVTFSSAATHSIVMTVTGKNSAATQFYITADTFTFVGQ
jgi:hypothetical protein